MEKLPMCRICLAQNTTSITSVVINKNLRDLYEKLTDVPFVTKDSRPILACYLCCAKLKQCFQLMRKCLEAEEQFPQIMNEPNPITNPQHLELGSGFTRSPIEQINIVEKLQAESVIKEELPAVCEGLDVIDETDELENVDNSYLDVKDIPPDHSEPDSEDDVPLMLVKIKLEEVIEVPEKKQTAAVPNSASVTRRTKLEDTITAELKKNEPSNLKVFRTTRNRTSKPGTTFKESDESDQRSKTEVKKRKQHTQTRISKIRYECDVCQHSFSRKDNLTSHIRKHTGVKLYKCDVCQRSFSEKRSLTKHIRIHTGEKPYTCDVCQRSFREKGFLTAHILIHAAVKPYKCDVCQRNFCQIGTLNRHTFRKHSGVTRVFEKPYKCDLCQRSFRFKGHLTTHIRIHTGEKPYKCDVCQRNFREKGQLKRHIRIHTGEKPYKCDLCQRSFSRISNLNTHILSRACKNRID